MTNTTGRFLLRVDEVHHQHGRAYHLADLVYLTTAARHDVLSRLPRHLTVHNCDTAEQCYQLHVIDTDGFSIRDTIEITEHDAHQLTGIDNFTTHRFQQLPLWAATTTSSQRSEGDR